MKNPFYENIFNLKEGKYKKDNKFLLTFLPGSRLSELKKAIPLFIDVVKNLIMKNLLLILFLQTNIYILFL